MAQYVAAAEVHLEKIRLVMKISPEKCQIGSLRDRMLPLSHHSGTNQVINIETFSLLYFDHEDVFCSIFGGRREEHRENMFVSHLH